MSNNDVDHSKINSGNSEMQWSIRVGATSKKVDNSATQIAISTYEKNTSFNQIISGSGQVVTQNESIVAASTQQSQAEGEIARNVERNSAVNRQHTAGATQVAMNASQHS
jgi:methyl-accepting chemotaxis protein